MFKLTPLLRLLGLFLIGGGGWWSATVQAALFFTTEQDGVHTSEFFVDKDDVSSTFVDLNFGTSSGAQLRFDVGGDDFLLNRNVDLQANELLDFRLERLAAAPTCAAAADRGRMYYDTVLNQAFVCDGTSFSALLENTLASANIFVGNASGVATGVAASGDLNVDNAGLFTIQDNSVDGTDIALGSDALGDLMSYDGTDWARLALGTSAQYLGVNDGGTNLVWENVDTLADDDLNTLIQVEEGANDNTIRFDTNGGERMIIDATGNVLVGASAETIANAAFVPDGNDVFVAGDLGVEGPIYTDATATKYKFVDIFGCVRGSAAAGTVGGGNSPVVRFDGTNNSQMRCSFPVPDDWQTGTDINMEIYFSPSDNTAGDVDWELFHAAFAVGETIAGGSFSDTVAAPSTIAINTQLDLYELNEDIPAAGLALDDMVNIRLRRNPGAAPDTYAGDINVHMIRISYTGKRLE